MDLTIPTGIGGKQLIELLREIDPEVKGCSVERLFQQPDHGRFHQLRFSGSDAKSYRISEMSRLLKHIIEGGERTSSEPLAAATNKVF